MKWDDIPDCCKNCKNFEDDWLEVSEISVHYCILNLKFPTRKLTCKKQKRREDKDAN